MQLKLIVTSALVLATGATTLAVVAGARHERSARRTAMRAYRASGSSFQASNRGYFSELGQIGALRTTPIAADEQKAFEGVTDAILSGDAEATRREIARFNEGTRSGAPLVLFDED